MRNRFCNYAVIMAGVLGISCVFSTAAAAQSGQVSKPGFGQAHIKALPPGKPTPRTADKHPDFSGIWIDGYTGSFDLTAEHDPLQGRYDRKVTPQEGPALQRWVIDKIKRMGPLEAAGTCLDCEPLNPIGIFIKGRGYEREIVQTRAKLVVMSELDTTYRTIWIDGRGHKKDADPQFNGDAVGHWEGDTLVVDVTGLDVHQWLSPTPNAMLGWFASDVLHITERLSRPDSNSFIYQYTVDDPKVLTRPWVSVPNHFSASREPMIEYYCTNNKDYALQNPGGPKYISASGLDERYFDDQEYQELKKQFPEPGK